jgi:hypothetical protein
LLILIGSVNVNNIFYGLLFVFLDFNVTFGNSKIGLIPDFIGFILIFTGLKELSAGKDRFSHARPFAAAMAVYTGILYGMDMLGISYRLEALIPFALGLVSTLVSLYISYNIVTGIKDLEAALGQDLNSRPLYSMWVALAALNLAIYFLFLIPEINLLCIIAGLVVGIAFLVLFSKTKNLYYGGK